MIVGAATGFLTGGPVGAAIGGAAGAVGGTNNLTSTVGNLGNTAASGWQSSILAMQNLQNEQNAIYSLQINQQASQFNNMMDEKSEMMRESNALRDVAVDAALAEAPGESKDAGRRRARQTTASLRSDDAAPHRTRTRSERHPRIRPSSTEKRERFPDRIHPDDLASGLGSALLERVAWTHDLQRRRPVDPARSPVRRNASNAAVIPG